MISPKQDFTSLYKHKQNRCEQDKKPSTKSITLSTTKQPPGKCKMKQLQIDVNTNRTSKTQKMQARQQTSK